MKPKIIVFATDGLITSEQRAYLRELHKSGIQAEVRNPALIEPGHAMEPCAGIHRFDELVQIPSQYAKQPNAEGVIADAIKARAARAALTEAPPVKAVPTAESKPNQPTPPPKPAPAAGTWGKGK